MAHLRDAPRRIEGGGAAGHHEAAEDAEQHAQQITGNRSAALKA
jgi:hypothetical protein